jgi:hypothetical protein
LARDVGVAKFRPSYSLRRQFPLIMCKSSRGVALQPASTHLTLLRWQCGNLLRRHLGEPLHERLSAASRANGRANGSPGWRTPRRVLPADLSETRLHLPEGRINVDRAAVPRFPPLPLPGAPQSAFGFEALVPRPHPLGSVESRPLHNQACRASLSRCSSRSWRARSSRCVLSMAIPALLPLLRYSSTAA